MAKPKISIIVPVYKVEKYIHECVDSILGQTLKEFELILINDGSPDNCGEICDEYARKDTRIKVIHKINEGPSATRNLGILISKGEYIGFVDADDIIQNNMYEKMYQIALKNNSDIISCGYIEFDKSGECIRESLNPLAGNVCIEGKEIKANLELLLSDNKILGYASMCNKLYKKSFLIDKKILINEKIMIAEDLCFNLIALSVAKNISAVNEGLYKYRRVNNESIMNKTEGSFYLHLVAREEILKTLKFININRYIYSKCEKYENSKTVAAYLQKIKEILNLKETAVKNKYFQIKNLIHEKYFLFAINNFNRNLLVLKANCLVEIVRSILFLEKMLRFKKI